MTDLTTADRPDDDRTAGGFSPARSLLGGVQPRELVETHGRRLREVGDAVHEARASFLRERFEGYVADTYYVENVGYVCWPALSGGRFEAYDELCERERRALALLVEEGFERLGVGLTRVVLAPPADEEFVVKLGRCGMGGGFGDGRQANLVEARLSDAAGPDAPIVPSVHCSGRGTFAVYPRVDPEAAGGSDYEGSIREIREWLSEHAPWMDRDEAVAPENRCVRRSRLCTLDYGHPVDRDGPLGVPGYVDGREVVERVDERRRAGEKPDLLDGGGLVEPDVR